MEAKVDYKMSWFIKKDVTQSQEKNRQSPTELNILMTYFGFNNCFPESFKVGKKLHEILIKLATTEKKMVTLHAHQCS
jgi:hypothetical protein